jgi:AraC-like DNA-binding protein
MVSNRCKLTVKEVLGRLGLHSIVEMGEADIMEDITPEQRNLIREGLEQSGLELMEDKKAMLIEKIKKIIIEMIHYTDELPKTNFSDYLADKLSFDYTYMAKLFSEVQGITIAQFIILHKIERVKELLIYDELNLTEIAWKMHYSSVAHLSNQFKKTTGLTPSQFKNLKTRKRVAIEDI